MPIYLVFEDIFVSRQPFKHLTNICPHNVWYFHLYVFSAFFSNKKVIRNTRQSSFCPPEQSIGYFTSKVTATDGSCRYVWRQLPPLLLLYILFSCRLSCFCSFCTLAICLLSCLELNQLCCSCEHFVVFACNRVWMSS